MKKSIVAGNWKMNKTPQNSTLFVSEVVANLDEIINVDVVFCPPFTSLNNLDISPPFYLGSQNCYLKITGLTLVKYLWICYWNVMWSCNSWAF